MTISQYKEWSVDRICKDLLSDENKILMDKSMLDQLYDENKILSDKAILEKYRKYKCWVFIDFEYIKKKERLSLGYAVLRAVCMRA